MSKKKSKRKSSKKETDKNSNRNRTKQQTWYALFAVLFLTTMVFLPSLQNEFVNWDDDKNFYENPLVTSSTTFADLFANTPEIFSTPIIGNYNPLSNWTFALENVIWGMDKPFYWHLDNLLLHLICVSFVFFITRRLGLSIWATVLCTLLFGIHPMRVESVAWLTERKDVLFGTFYLAALYYYILGLRDRKPNKYIFTILILFLLSGLSKIQAVTLPLSMLAVDYYLGRPVKLKRILEKWFYFAISILIGLLGIYFLRQHGSLESNTDFTLLDRLFVGSYSYMTYLVKLLIPFELLPLYPYPAALSSWHYISMIPALAILALVVWSYLKEWKALTFGLLFFTFNIMFLLQILGAGQGYLADRFTYIAYFGLFFAIAFYLEKVSSTKPKSLVVNLGVSLYLIVLAFITYQQNKIWKNSGTLWSAVVLKYPNTTLPWGNRANFYRDAGFLDLALSDYNRAITLDKTKAAPFNSRAKLYFRSNNRDTILLALADYNQAINLDQTNGEYYMNRGATFARLGGANSALRDLIQAEQFDPNNPTIFLNRSIVYHQLGQYQNEINDILKYMKLNPRNAMMYVNLGNAQMYLGQWDQALQNINTAINMNPNVAVFYFYKAQYYYNTGDAGQAQQNLSKAIAMGFQFNGTIENLKL